MVYKCKICGGQTNVDTQNGIAICEYCGTKQALPLFSEESERLLYESGNNYLMHSEYDKAENVFNQLLTIKPNAAELYWDLVLCKYGVTYVEDPQTGKYIPTCNRTHYTPIFSDENYKKAIELSSGEKKTLFEEDAKTIDNIQKGIIAVSKKEKPFDIFISYKETDANGNRTKDSVEAQKLYEKLTKEGYKVFFSRITLEDKIGTEYEPYIYAALYSSKVMITLCSSKENIEAVWVKNEWSRFLGFRQQDSSKTVLPLYFDMAKEELPDEFMLLSSYDMTVDGFEEELLRGIKKLIPLPIMKAKRRKKIMKITGITVAALIVVIGIASAIIVPKKLEEKRLLEEAQKQIEMERIYGDAYENALALFNEGDYVGAANAFNAISEYKDSKQMAEKADKEIEYLSAITLFENKDYTGAEEAFKKLGDFKDSAHMVERCPIQPQYDEAMQYYYDGKYAQSAWAFEKLGDYEDAKEQKAKAESAWRYLLANIYSNEYYVTENGTATIKKGKDGNKHTQIDISKNGRVVSIECNSIYSSFDSKLTVLHENGIVSHPELDMKLDSSQWHNIVKVSETFRSEIIGLRSDGKIVVFSENKKLNELLEWDSIIDFKESYSPGNGLCCGYILGLRADGSLCATQYSDDPEYFSQYMTAINEVLNNFKNVKSFAFTGEADLSNLLALTYDNKLISYSDGKYIELNGNDICDVITADLVLKLNGELVELSSGKVLIRDVVYCEADSTDFCYAVTRNGNINTVVTYQGQITVKEFGSKTTVFEEWTSRLN